MIQLSKGAIARIMNGEEVDNPIVQVLNIKKLAASGNGGDRYRLLISDGEFLSSFTMLATQLNNMITDNIIDTFAVIEISRYAMSKANTGAGQAKKIMIVLGLEIKAKGSEVKSRIGDPKLYELSNNSTDNDSSSTSSAAPSKTTSSNFNTSVQQKKQNVQQSSRLNDSINSGNEVLTTPINALSPYQNRWVIKARICNKSDIRTWNNARGSGKLFSMDLIDESGEIRCTAFQDQVDKFYNLLEIQKLYYISRAQIKLANKTFNTLKHDYEMTITGDTEVIPCNEESTNIPLINYEFIPIKEIGNKEKDASVDVMGIVKSADNVIELTSKAGRELKKRDVYLIDKSKVIITLTLWGSQAENFQITDNPVVAIKSARIGEFNGGKSLSTTMSSVLLIDPDIPEAHSLRGWFASIDLNSDDIQSLSKTSNIGGSMIGNWMLLKEGKARGMQTSDAPETFICKGTINVVRTENIMYKACPSENCNKKIIENDGVYRCEKCNQDWQSFKPRLLAHMAISDFSSFAWASTFHDDVEKIVGQSAQELHDLKDVDNDEFIKKFTNLAFQSFAFKVRIRMGIYNDQPKLNTVIAGVSPLNFKTYNNHLLKQIKLLANVNTM